MSTLEHARCSSDTFYYPTQEYTEKLKFRKNMNPVRNRLGSNEQFIGALDYETSIKDRNNVEIHFEMGQYLWLGVWTEEGAVPYNQEGDPVLYSRKTTEADVKNDFMFPTLAAGSQGPQFVPPFSISRQGSIPHGNSIQLFGKQPSTSKRTDSSNGQLIPDAPEIYPGVNKGILWDADSVAFHPSMGYTAQELNEVTAEGLPAFTAEGLPAGKGPPSSTRVKPAFAAELAGYPTSGATVDSKPLEPNSSAAYMGRIFNGAQKLNQPDGTVVEESLFPYCVQPNIRLVEANQKLKDDGFDIISHDKCDPLVQTSTLPPHPYPYPYQVHAQHGHPAGPPGWFPQQPWHRALLQGARHQGDDRLIG